MSGHIVYYRDPGSLTDDCILECVLAAGGEQRVMRLAPADVLDLLHSLVITLRDEFRGAILSISSLPSSTAGSVAYAQTNRLGTIALERITTWDGERLVEAVSRKQIAWLTFHCTTALARHYDLAERAEGRE